LNRCVIDVCIPTAWDFLPLKKVFKLCFVIGLRRKGRRQLSQAKRALSRRRGLGGGAVAAMINTFIEV